MFIQQGFLPTERSSSPQRKFLTPLSLNLPPQSRNHPDTSEVLQETAPLHVRTPSSTACKKVTTYKGLPRARGEPASSSSSSSWGPEAGAIAKEKSGGGEGVRGRGGQE